MSILAFDLEQYHRQIFGGKPYIINGKNIPKSDEQFSKKSLIKTKYLDKEIWLPIKFYNLRNIGFSFGELLLPYSTIKIGGKQSMVKTSLVERKGTVKELFNQDDYDITIKGFAIDDENRIFPEKQIEYLKGIYEGGQSIGLDNAITNIFLADQGCQVVVESIDFPEVIGGRKHVRPFVMTLCSDNVFELVISK